MLTTEHRLCSKHWRRVHYGYCERAELLGRALVESLIAIVVVALNVGITLLTFESAGMTSQTGVNLKQKWNMTLLQTRCYQLSE